MDAKTLEGLRNADPETMESLGRLLSEVSLHQDEMTDMWRCVAEGMKKAWDTGNAPVRSRLVDFALALGRTPHDNDVCERYGDLAMIYGFPNTMEASTATSRTAARVARMSRQDPEVKDDAYLALAMDSLLAMLQDGDADCRGFAAAGLAYLPDPRVRGRLMAMAKGGRDEQLREAAGESIGLMRTAMELELAEADRELLLAVEYPDGSDPRRECLEQMLDAAGTVLRANGRDQDEGYAAAVRQLAVFGERPDEVTVYFYGKRDRRLLSRMMRHAENALFRALTRAKEDAVREDAAYGLEAIGGERVEKVLGRIAAREGEESPVGRLASETLARIRGNSVEILSETPLPPPRPKRKITDPKQVLKVKM